MKSLPQQIPSHGIVTGQESLLHLGGDARPLVLFDELRKRVGAHTTWHGCEGEVVRQLGDRSVIGGSVWLTHSIAPDTKVYNTPPELTISTAE